MPVIVGNVFYFTWEVQLMEWLQSVLPGWIINVISQFSAFGEQLPLVAILGFLYWSLDKEFGKYVGVNILVVNIWNPMVKNIFVRRRPYFDNPGIKILRPVEPDADLYDISAQGFSFTSGHSANAVTAYGSISRYAKKRWLRVLAILLPLLVGFSRVVVGAHYPTDVLCGWGLGVLVIFVVPLLQKVIKKRWMFNGLMLLIALPGFFYCKSTDYYSGVGMLIGFLAALPVEEKYVKFENTKSWVRRILRVIGGGAIYLGLNTVLKLPFSSEFLASPTMGAFFIRTLRYAIIIFVVIAIYPMLFKYTARIGQARKDTGSEDAQVKEGTKTTAD